MNRDFTLVVLVFMGVVIPTIFILIVLPASNKKCLKSTNIEKTRQVCKMGAFRTYTCEEEKYYEPVCLEYEEN